VVIKDLRIVITRPAARADTLAERLRERGAQVFIFPLIRVERLPESHELQTALDNIGVYDYIAFTSANAVATFPNSARLKARAKVACVGPATAEAARARGWQPTIIPETNTAAAIADEIVSMHDVRGRRVLFPRAAAARDALSRKLRQAGAQVDEIKLYRTVPDLAGAAELKDFLRRQVVDLLTFMSGSAVACYVQHVGPTASTAHIAVIGPSTAIVAEKQGLRVSIHAHPHTSDGLIQAIEQSPLHT
jgi:uroporphyrinogen-III synthase